MFLRAEDPPRERFLVKLHIELPDGPLDATAFVSRRVQRNDEAGVGVQFFALSSQAKGRWDTFVGTLSGAHDPVRERETGIPADSSTFLIKLRNVERMVDFFERNVRSGRVSMNTPLLRPVGAPVALIVIHPESEREFLFRGTVARVEDEPAKSMELELDPVTEKLVARFYDFVATGTPTETMDLLIHPPEPTSSRSELTDAHRFDDEPIPFAFEVDTETGDLSVDIEVDADASEELEALSDPRDAGTVRGPLDWVGVRCTACGAFLGAVEVAPLPEPIVWVATRRVRYDRFSLQLVTTVEPADDDELSDGERVHGHDTIGGEALFELARRFKDASARRIEAPDLGPAIRRAAADLITGRDRALVEAPCPACGESTVFASPE